MKKILIFILMSSLFLTSNAFAAQLEVGFNQTYSTIQDAINNSLNGDIINIHAGEYQEEITVNKSVTLQGSTGIRENVILYQPTTREINCLISADNVTIKDLSFLQKDPTAWNVKPISGTRFSNFVLDNCYFSSGNSGEDYDGIYIYDVNGFTMKNCEFYSDFRRPLYLEESSTGEYSNIVITDNVFTCSIDTYGNDCITLYGLNENCLLSNILIKNNTLLGANGWYEAGNGELAGIRLDYVCDVLIEDNILDTYHKTEALTTSHCNNVTVRNNQIHKGYILIYAADDVHYYNNDIYAPYINVIYLSSNVTNSDFYNNIIRGNDENGIMFNSKYSSNVSIYENEIYNCGYYDSSDLYAAIKIDDININDSFIYNNYIHNCNHGIVFTLDTPYNSNFSFENNIIENIDNEAIYLRNTNMNTFTNNTISNCSSCIKFNGDSSSNQFIANTFEDENLIHFDVSTSMVCSGNRFYLNNFNTSAYITTSVDQDAVVGKQYWESENEIEYQYNGNIYNNILGNYWALYDGIDNNGDGIGDTSFPLFNGIYDDYPLMIQYSQNNNEENNNDNEDENNNENDNEDENNNENDNEDKNAKGIIINPSNNNDSDDDNDSDNNWSWDKIKDIIKPYIPDWLKPDNNNNENNNNINPITNDTIVELMLELDLLELNDLNGDEDFVELMQTSLEKHPINFLFINFLIILILASIRYYLKEK